MADMVKKEIIPACIGYQKELAQLLCSKKVCGEFDSTLEEHLLSKLSKLSAGLLSKLDALEAAVLEAKSESGELQLAKFYRDRVFGAMSELRLTVDELETLVAKEHWPLPTYADMLFSVN